MVKLSFVVGGVRSPQLHKGAGVAGLCSAKYFKEAGITFTVLEATRYLGGTWRYDPRVGTDEDGLPIHTSMYKNLRTNLAAPAMELKGFPVPKEMPAFPSWKAYYEYVVAYATHFDLEKYIKFQQLVTLVNRKDNKWTVRRRDVLSGDICEDAYENIVVATGHFTKTRWPDIPGAEIFEGKIIHSHDYREPEVFQNRRVLIIGIGPSGMDIAVEVAAVSKTLYHSHHSKANIQTPFPPHYIIKPDVKELKERIAVFVDGTSEVIDDIIYCTGYEFDYQFLDETSELTITSKYILPLYKSIVNINQPSMMFLGVINCACNVIAIDAQARYATALLAGHFSLPTQAEMMEQLHRHINQLKTEQRPLCHIHYLGKDEDEYYEELTRESGIDRVPPVMTKLRLLDFDKKLENLYTYRDYVYTIIDNETFTRHFNPIQSGSGDKAT